MPVNKPGHKAFDQQKELKPKRKQELFFIKADRGFACNPRTCHIKPFNRFIN
jgi:hypothetical protein